MMRHASDTLGFHFFHCIVEKEIYKNSIDLCSWMPPDDLTPQKLNTPNAAPSKLHLPWVATFDECESAYVGF